MSTQFPTAIDTFPNPVSTDLLENANDLLDHDVQHSNVNDAIKAIEAKIGIDGSGVQTSFSYKLSAITGADKAVGLAATQTLTNKTLNSPKLNFGSDSAGDTYYRDGSGNTVRLPIGTTGNVLSVAGGVPVWIPNPAASDGSTTVKGVFQAATLAQVNAGTATGSTGAVLVVTPDVLVSSNYRPSQFLGTGADGALSVSSGVTNIDLGGLQYVIKNYTTISITGTGQVKFINPHANGTICIVKCQGQIDLTSSTIPNLDMSGCGGAGGAAGVGSASVATSGGNGNEGTGIMDSSTHGGGGGLGIPPLTPGTAGAVYSNLYLYTRSEFQITQGITLACGSGGGGSAGATNAGGGTITPTTLDGGKGGNGGGGLIIQCGALNFTSALGISVAGLAGGNGTSFTSTVGANAKSSGGAGGGAGGFCVVIYNSLVANSGTINSAGGAGGTGGNGSNIAGGAGGGTQREGATGAGAGAYGSAGGAAATFPGNTLNGTNGTGAAGVQAGGGGGSGVGTVYNVTASYTGGTGGAGGASAGGLVIKNYYFV